METRQIELSLDTAKRLYEQGGEYRDIALTAFKEHELIGERLPKTWEEYCAKHGGVGDKIDEFMEELNYRIKPEPKYRPFKSQEECLKEMLKHQPFAFLSSANEYDWFSICRVFEEEGIPKITFASNPYSDYDMTKVFDTFQFADGTPFGIKEE